jgi:kynurenine formamidase
MIEIIDLSQEIYTGIPVYPGLPHVKINVHVTHEEWDGETEAKTATPGVNKIEMGEQEIAAFGVETMSPGVRNVSNKEVHRICGKMGFTHYENMANLHQLIGRDRFRFIGLPLKIRGGTGSPVRAIAVFE